MLRESGVFAEVDFIAVGHFLLSDGDGDDDFDDGLFWGLVHLIYNDNLIVKIKVDLYFLY